MSRLALWDSFVRTAAGFSGGAVSGARYGSVRLRALKAAGISVLALLLSLVFAQPLSFSTGALIGGNGGDDFSLTDFYAMVADSRPVRTYESDIMVIDIDKADRDEIADLLDILPAGSPKAIGLDVTFNESRGEDDAHLLEAVRNCPNLVLALGVSANDGDYLGTFNADDYSFFYPATLDELAYGVINLPTKTPGGAIRHMAVDFPDSVGRPMPGFVAELVRLAAPERYRELHRRGHKTEPIHYPSRTIDTMDYSEVPDRISELEGRIVLVGALNELGDVYCTPVNRQMAGVMIHAYSLATVLHGDYMSIIPEWVNYMLALMLCFMLVFAILTPWPPIKGLCMRIAQVAMLYLIIRFSYWLYVDEFVLIDFSCSLMMLTFGFFACDVWVGGEYALQKLRERFTPKDKTQNIKVTA